MKSNSVFERLKVIILNKLYFWIILSKLPLTEACKVLVSPRQRYDIRALPRNGHQMEVSAGGCGGLRLS